MMERTDATERLRRYLRDLPEGAQHDLGSRPVLDQVYALRDHGGALDPERPVVVGNRGVGKTFWTLSLLDPAIRQHLAGQPAYQRLGLGSLDVRLGFVAGYGDATRPDAGAIASCERIGIEPHRIWEAALLRLTAPDVGQALPTNLKDVAAWAQANPEDSVRLLRQVDNSFVEKGKRLLVIYDGLDTLGETWRDLRTRLSGLLKFAGLVRGLRAVRLKLFLRIDQAEDDSLWAFPDASKLYNGRVRLRWSGYDLHDLLLFHLTRHDGGDALRSLVPIEWLPGALPESFHRMLFSSIAGKFMGGHKKRGNTYDWVIDHLSDAWGETTPRSFLVMMKEAAKVHSPFRPLVIDHLDIREGVIRASEARLNELSDDYWWINIAFQPLDGAMVPCLPGDFDGLWKQADTVNRIYREAETGSRLPPLAFTANGASEESLRSSLTMIGVLEERTNGKINVPDIFRVAAGMKRRGGVRPPPRPGSKKP